MSIIKWEHTPTPNMLLKYYIYSLAFSFGTNPHAFRTITLFYYFMKGLLQERMGITQPHTAHQYVI